MFDGEQEIVSPPGEDAVVRSTVPANPAVDCRRIVDVPDAPETKVTADGFATREKSGRGTGVTETPIEMEWVRFPLVPVIVTVYEPVVVPFIVQAADWLPARVEGEHVVFTPDDEEVAFRLTVPEKPPVDWSAIVDVAEWFTTNETLFGFAVKEKSGGTTVAWIVAVWTKLPLVPAIVTR